MREEINSQPAQITNHLSYRDLLWQLIKRDLKLKYRRSFLGYCWSVLNPLFTMVILAVVFSQMFQRSIPNYPVYLISGQVCFNFMTQTTNLAMASITGNAALLKKVYVPKYIFTLAKVSSGLFDFIFTLAALFIVMLFTGAPFSAYLLWIPLIALQLYIFILGVGLILAVTDVFFRDIQYIYHVMTTAWMYLTPLFYPFESLSPRLRWAIECFNPMYLYVHAFRQVCMYGAQIDFGYFIRGWIWALGMLVVGIIVFKKKQDDFILYI